MSYTHYFHFTIGPVQSFVAQARKTRDFWAGSFILSWLSGVAMKEVVEQGGEILFPKVNEFFLQYVSGENADIDNAPAQGNIPNRFKAEIESGFDPRKIEKAVRFAWNELAELIYKNDLIWAPSETEKIWQRQIEKFWEITWIITADIQDSAALDRRKNLRTWMPPDEPGVKCSVMEGWQELSGAETPYSAELNQFWRNVNNNCNGIANDLKEKERLCAMAWVKRRFVYYFKDLAVDMPSGWYLKGWDIPTTVPSVVYMAAVHWWEKVIRQAKDDSAKLISLKNFQKSVEDNFASGNQWNREIDCIAEVSQELDFQLQKNIFLDGSIFFETELQNKNIFPKQDIANNVRLALKKIDASSPTPFYAVLMMDGDSLGKHMANPDKQEPISTGLQQFTSKVPVIVKQNNGFLVYAGGDDVLAILPLEDALVCATKIRLYYLSCFQETSIPTTISAAIEYVHIHIPLTKVLKDAHDLLDNIAKDARGRDAIAVRIWNPGGNKIEWAQPWKVVLDKDNHPIIKNLAAEFQSKSNDSEQFSSRFFYKIEKHFELLNPPANSKDVLPVLEPEEAIDFMTAEYLTALPPNTTELETNKDAVRERVKTLLGQCRPVVRKMSDEGEKIIVEYEKSDRLEVDGALLLRFLAMKGVQS